MYDVLRDRIWRNLEALPEEKLYQVLDYIEFLSSKYSREPVRAPSAFQKFGEKLEDRLRGNRVGLDAIRSTLDVVGTADRMVSGLTEAGRSLIREVGASATAPATPQPPTRTPIAPPREQPATPRASTPPSPTRAPIAPPIAPPREPAAPPPASTPTSASPPRRDDIRIDES